MRSLVLFCEILGLNSIALARPFAGVLTYAWVSFMSPHQLVFGGIGTSMPWALVSFLATMIGCVVAREPKRMPINGVTVSIALFAVGISLTSIFALAPSYNVLEKYTMVSKTCLFVLVAAALLTSKERIHALIWVMVLSLAFFGVKGGAFTLVHGGSHSVVGPPGTIISDNNQLAVGLLTALPLMNYLRRQSAHKAIRLALIITMVLTVFAVVGTYSRGALIGLTAVGIYLWWKSPGKIISGILLFALIAAAITFMPDQWVQRMDTIETYQSDGSAMGRLQIWHTAWVIATSRPLIGGGFAATYVQGVVNMFTPGVEFRAVHSVWLEVLAEHGFPVFFIWVGITVAAALATRRIIKMATGIPELEWCVDLAKMYQVSMIGYLVGGSFLSLSYWDFYFTMLVAAAATDEYVRAAVGQKDRRPRVRESLVASRQPQPG